MRYFILFLLLSGLFLSCKKEQNRRALGAYFKFTVNGAEIKIEDGAGIYENKFDCIIQGDTGLYINVEKQVEGAGIIIKGRLITDTTYALDSLHYGYYVEPHFSKRYFSTNANPGTLTIKKGTFEGATTINTLEGTFSFPAVDTTNGSTLQITNGSFLMEVQHQ